MQKFLRSPITVPFGSIYLDPNNPRLGRDDAPGYGELDKLFDDDLQAEVEEQLAGVYDVDALVGAVIGQGWMPIDNIVVWTHPDSQDRHLVVEGNTRSLALRKIRGQILDREKKKLDRMEAGGGKKYAEADIKEQRRLVAHLEEIVSDTQNLEVVPLHADTIEELNQKLPRVLAVRHITGAKEWGNYAEDLWLLQRFYQLFEDKHGKGANLFWDPDLVKRVADEASLSATKAKRQLRAASSFSHFRAEFEDQLPEGEEFKPSDYYLFENIVKKPFIREQLGLGEDDRHLPPEGEQALFAWVFREPRGKNADDNPNVFYRHENVLLWDQIKRYDDKHGTAFASRFDATDFENVPTMREVEAEYVSHKARKKPHAVLDELLRRLKELTAETLATEGEFLRTQLEQLRDHSVQYLKMIEAAEA